MDQKWVGCGARNAHGHSRASFQATRSVLVQWSLVIQIKEVALPGRVEEAHPLVHCSSQQVRVKLAL